MKISIITVAFNSSATIRETLESVMIQTYPNIEYIVVDGLSNDNTIEIVKEFESNFNGRMRWVSEKDKGLYDAMNKGITIAKGDVIGFLNSDDLFCDEYSIEKVMRIFALNDSLDSVYADLYYVSQLDTSRIIRHWVSGKQRSFSSGWHPAHPTLYLKKRVYVKYGLFNLDFRLAADFEIMLRFFERYRISTYYLKDSLVKMRLGGATNRSLKNIIYQNLECLRAFKINEINVNKASYHLLRLLPKLLQF